MVYVNDLGGVDDASGYQRRYWSLSEILKNNLCLHLDGYPRSKGPLPESIIAELKQRGWTVKEKHTGLDIAPIVRFLCPPGLGPDDGAQD